MTANKTYGFPQIPLNKPATSPLLNFMDVERLPYINSETAKIHPPAFQEFHSQHCIKKSLPAEAGYTLADETREPTCYKN